MTDSADITANKALTGDDTTAEILTEFQERARQALTHSGEWRTEASNLFDVEAGRQWDPVDDERMKEAGKPMVTFNVFAKFIDAVIGLQINNRQEIRCYPREAGDAAISDLATGSLAWTREACDAEFEETDAGHDLLLTGMGWTETFLDERSQEDSIIAKERRDPLEMLWDPAARKKNLMDRAWQCRLKRWDAKEYKDTFGEDPAGDVAIGITKENELESVLKVIDKPQDYRVDTIAGAEVKGRPLVADYQYMVVEDAWKVQATFPGEGQPRTQHFTVAEWSKVEEALNTAKIQFEANKVRRNCYYRAWITSSGIPKGIKKLDHGFTFECLTGKRDRNKNTWYGLGRGLHDPQLWVNKFFSSILWQLSVNPKGGLLAEEDAFTDMQKAEQSWSDPSQITFAAPGAIVKGKIQPKPAGQYPQGMDRLMTFSMEALPQTSGINAEVLGLTNRDQPGVVEAQRKQGALAIVAWFFDALHRHYKSSGKLTLALIRDHIADGRLIRIAGDAAAQYVPLMKDKLTQQYDIIVDEAPTSVNMRERVWAILQQIIPIATQMGVRVPKEVLDYMPVPADLAQKWKANLETPPDQAQMQQRAAVAKISKDEGSAKASEASAQLDTAKAQEIAATAPAKAQQAHVEALHTAALTGSEMAGG